MSYRNSVNRLAQRRSGAGIAPTGDAPAPRRPSAGSAVAGPIGRRPTASARPDRARATPAAVGGVPRPGPRRVRPMSRASGGRGRYSSPAPYVTIEPAGSDTTASAERARRSRATATPRPRRRATDDSGQGLLAGP